MGQKHTSMPSDPHCPLCIAWCNSPCERAFSNGDTLDPIDAHRMLVVGFWYARNEKLVMPVCPQHRRMLEQLDIVRDETNQAEALKFRPPS